MKVEQILKQLKNVHRIHSGWTARCPAHEDKHNSLSIGEGENGKALIHCHAGCSYTAIMTVLGLMLNSPKRKQIVAEYAYRDERSNVLYEVVRSESKKFLQRRPNKQGGWIWNLDGVRRVLYRLPELIASDGQATVFIAEGEKDVDRLCSVGLTATTNAGGAGKWRKDYNEFLLGRKVVILPDNDIAGRRHAEEIARSLQGVASSVKIVPLAGLPEKGDVSDYFSAGNKVDDLLAIVEATEEWNSMKSTDAATETQGGNDEAECMYVDTEQGLAYNKRLKHGSVAIPHI